MVKEELKQGHIYIIKHNGARVRARFEKLLEGEGYKGRRYTHYKFLKLTTNREVVLYSTQKIIIEEEVAE